MAITVTVTFCIQLIISLSSILLNGLGIYCIRTRKKGNRNQLLLQQNLACIDIFKTVYDFIPWIIYKFQEEWYLENAVYLEIVEVNMMTLMFISVILITLDRFLCVVLELKYGSFVSLKRTENIICCTWLISMTPGFFLWAFFSNLNSVKMYYYLSFDLVIIVIIVTTYTLIINVIQKRNETLSVGGGRREKLKMQAVAFSLMLSFTLCNAIPDLIYTAHAAKDTTYDAVSVLWSLGYLLDPVIYIFTAQEMRRIAKASIVSVMQTRSTKYLNVILTSMAKAITNSRHLHTAAPSVGDSRIWRDEKPLVPPKSFHPNIGKSNSINDLLNAPRGCHSGSNNPQATLILLTPSHSQPEHCPDFHSSEKKLRRHTLS